MSAEQSTGPLSPERLEEIRAREAAATAGPWRWRGNTEARHLRLQTPDRGGLTVMDFDRWGMQGARPRFARDYVMHPADEMVTYEVAAWSTHIYRKDVVGIEHPDAEFIAKARTDVPQLLDEVDRLAGALAEAEARVAELRQAPVQIVDCAATVVEAMLSVGATAAEIAHALAVSALLKSEVRPAQLPAGAR